MEAAASTDNVLLYPSVQVELEVTGLKSPVFHFLMLLAAGGYSALVYALVRVSLCACELLRVLTVLPIPFTGIPLPMTVFECLKRKINE